MLLKNTLLVLSFFSVNCLAPMQHSDSREKIEQDRVLFQCTLGALSTNPSTLSASFAIDTPENRTATLAQFRLLLRDEAQSLANPELFCKNRESKNTPTKLNYSIKTHFIRTRINEEMLAQWSRKHDNQTQIPFNELSNLISARLK